MMVAAGSFEILPTTRRHVPEESDIHIRPRENPKSHLCP
jgi:hypothetical protein